MTIVRVARPASLPPPTDRFVVVEASAGTGKTYFLEHRVVDLILGANAELGQILLVTFTEKAVAELRLRIRDVLDRLARATEDTASPGDQACWEIDDAGRVRLRAAVHAFDHAPIFTIHGFCHRVLVEDAFAARRLFEQSQIADEVAFETAFTALLRERFARAEPDRELLARFLEKPARNTVDDLRHLLLQCARTGAPPRRRYDPDEIRATVAPIYAAFGDEASRAELLATLSLNNKIRRFVPGWLADVDGALARAAHEAPAPRLLAVIDALRDPLDKLHKYLVKSHPALAADIARCVAATSADEAITSELLPHILERIGADKAEQGLFDYDDMLALVRDALMGDRGAALASRLRARMPWVMIDEFQDTDPTQWQIFRTVWMHPEANGLTIVGDPKQAIYGFRGADVDTYLRARDDLERAGATRVTLDINRRSTAQLVEAVNTILNGNPLAPLMTGAISYDTPVKPCGDILCDDHRKPVTVFALRGGGREPNRAALAGAIGDAIERLRADPPPWRDRRGVHPFSLDQVMVLTRSNRDSTELAAALRGRGLSCVLVESDHLFETREAAELAAVLAAIAAPRDRSARLRALRTRFFDVPWAELMRVVDAPDHHPLIARLFDWAQLAGRRAYEPLFRRIVDDSRFAERALVLGGGERALTNTWHLIELILEEVARSRGDLHELVVQLRAWIADRSDRFDDRDVQRAESDADAIRILTIHKAKGLEAPYVFVYGGTNKAPAGQVHTLRDPVGRLLVVDPHDPATRLRLDDDRDTENQRLAYVALTRAQVRLYLPHYGDNVITDTVMYHPIQRSLGPLVTRGHALVETIPIDVGDDHVAPAPADALAGFLAPAPPPVEERAPLPGLRGGLAMLSYTRLAHDLGAAAIGRSENELAIEASEFDIDDSVGEVGPNDLPAGASSGLLLHDVLEIADLDAVRRAPDLAAWAGDPIVRAQLERAARERGVGAGFLPHAAEIIHRTLTAPLELVGGRSLPPLVDADVLAREVEFTFPLPGSPVRGFVRGFIDALIGWGDELWVLDYKSDAIGHERPAAIAEARAHERYAVQARLYGLAADRLRGKRRLAGVLFMFIREHVIVPVRIDDAALAEWSRWLAALQEARA